VTFANMGEECREGNDFKPLDILAENHPVDVLTIEYKRCDVGFDWCLVVVENVK
jgi:hypothetical protein